MELIKMKLIIVAFVTLAAVGLTESSWMGDKINDFLESGRVTSCPWPGVERLLQEQITLYKLNFPKESCRQSCQQDGLISIEGTEKAYFGRKIYCCCKKAEEDVANEDATKPAANTETKPAKEEVASANENSASLSATNEVDLVEP